MPQASAHCTQASAYSTETRPGRPISTLPMLSCSPPHTVVRRYTDGLTGGPPPAGKSGCSCRIPSKRGSGVLGFGALVSLAALALVRRVRSIFKRPLR
jgi:MYXO-CTERM domain-containing protein